MFHVAKPLKRFAEPIDAELPFGLRQIPSLLSRQLHLNMSTIKGSGCSPSSLSSALPDFLPTMMVNRALAAKIT
jgi:hypothetical protein